MDAGAEVIALHLPYIRSWDGHFLDNLWMDKVPDFRHVDVLLRRCGRAVDFPRLRPSKPSTIFK
jgi:hypothetical protein